MSNYPNSVDQFSTKLNKTTDAHRIGDEIVAITDDKGEKFLKHDNIVDASIEVWTLPEKMGTKILTFTLERQFNQSWRTLITVFTEVSTVYITYDALGDMVEADDINAVQDAITNTQVELDRHKDDKTTHLEGGIVDGGSFQ